VPVVTGPIERPRVGVVKLASCDGCQLTLLDLEDQLLDIAERYDLAQFPEATSRRWDGRFDVLFVEGSVSTPEHVEELRELRGRSDLLVTIGACATAGGIQALRNYLDQPTVAAAVYPEPAYVASLATATPVGDHVTVDLELRGCPISPSQILELLTALRVGRRPQLPAEAVCAACKRRGIACVLVAGGLPCLGPVTAAGCGALCPAFGRACYGCFGPVAGANVAALSERFAGLPSPPDDIGATFALFSNWAEPYRSTVAASPALANHPDAREPQTESEER
jgi:coenzyme F420-reducing hydrogenase gamma subunit